MDAIRPEGNVFVVQYCFAGVEVMGVMAVVSFVLRCYE